MNITVSGKDDPLYPFRKIHDTYRKLQITGAAVFTLMAIFAAIIVLNSPYEIGSGITAFILAVAAYYLYLQSKKPFANRYYIQDIDHLRQELKSPIILEKNMQAVYAVTEHYVVIDDFAMERKYITSAARKFDFLQAEHFTILVICFSVPGKTAGEAKFFDYFIPPRDQKKIAELLSSD